MRSIIYFILFYFLFVGNKILVFHTWPKKKLGFKKNDGRNYNIIKSSKGIFCFFAKPKWNSILYSQLWFWFILIFFLVRYCFRLLASSCMKNFTLGEIKAYWEPIYRTLNEMIKKIREMFLKGSCGWALIQVTLPPLTSVGEGWGHRIKASWMCL